MRRRGQRQRRMMAATDLRRESQSPTANKRNTPLFGKDILHSLPLTLP